MGKTTDSRRRHEKRKSHRKSVSPWKRVIVGVLSFFLVSILALGGVAYSELNKLNETIPRFELAKVRNDQDVWAVIASDSRADAPHTRVYMRADQAQSERADIIFLVRRNGKNTEVLAVPRDIDMPYRDRKTRFTLLLTRGESFFNSSMCAGMKVSASHMVIVTINGMIDLVNFLGGVEVDIPYPIKDRQSGLDLNAGRQTLDGEQAVALVRSRYPVIYKDGKWQSITLTEGADSRNTHAWQVGNAIIAKIKSIRDPFKLRDLAYLIAKETRIDKYTKVEDALPLFTGNFRFQYLDTVVTSEDALHRRITPEGWQQLKELGFYSNCRTYPESIGATKPLQDPEKETEEASKD